jgi:tetratricopeptide (TPR) repeat protein
VGDGYLERAELLADLGRYDEAAAELEQAVAQSPGYTPAYTLLARVRLADGKARQALAAAEAAVAADPTAVPALIAHGMACATLGRVDEAAADAEQVLRRARGDGTACTSAAAILADVRNGQVALDAAWEGVRLTPDQPRAHLVLGLVAARLGLKDIAVRAYREALRLDPQLPEAHAAALGMIRWEQHRYARALAHLADADAAADPAAPRPADTEGVPGGGARAGRAGRGMPLVLAGLRRLIYVGAAYAVVAPVLVAWAAGTGTGAAGWALLLSAVGFAGLGMVWIRLPDDVRARLPEQLRADRNLAVTTAAVVAAPALLLLFVVLGSAWLLVATIVAGAVALLVNRPEPPA